MASTASSTLLRFSFRRSDDGTLDENHWRITLDVNVTGNYLLADEAKRVLLEQGLPSTIVLTSSANAVVPKRGSEAYDVSKSAVNHLIGELAIGLKPLVRVNGIAPATVVEGSTMFPRERLIPSLKKYNLPAGEDEPTEAVTRSSGAASTRSVRSRTSRFVRRIAPKQ